MAELSPLRRRMIEDMTVRNMSPATQRSYISAVSKFSRYFGKSPERLDLEDVRAFQLHLVSTGISWPGLNQIRWRPCASSTASRSARRIVPKRIPYARAPRKLLIVRSCGRSHAVFGIGIEPERSRAALTTANAAGLRASEVAGLRSGGHRQRAGRDPGLAWQRRQGPGSDAVAAVAWHSSRPLEAGAADDLPSFPVGMTIILGAPIRRCSTPPADRRPKPPG